MLDCQLHRLGSIHVHKTINDTKATVFTRYHPDTGSHHQSIRNARASSGTMRLPDGERGRGAVAAGGSVEVELFLKGDDFGETPTESVVFRFSDRRRDLRVLGVSHPGLGWGEARVRELDRGLCRQEARG